MSSKAATAGIQDGRLHRSARTKAAIAAAFVALIDEGHINPTSHEVAERAGVGHRSVFRHFQDMESLYGAIRDEIAARALPLLRGPAPTGPLSKRVQQLVLKRSRFHARINHFRRAMFARYWHSPTLKAFVQKNQIALRELTRRALPESAALSAADFEMLDLLLSYEAWARLRELQGLSERQARQVITAGVSRLLQASAT